MKQIILTFFITSLVLSIVIFANKYENNKITKNLSEIEQNIIFNLNIKNNDGKHIDLLLEENKKSKLSNNEIEDYIFFEREHLKAKKYINKNLPYINLDNNIMYDNLIHYYLEKSKLENNNSYYIESKYSKLYSQFIECKKYNIKSFDNFLIISEKNEFVNKDLSWQNCYYFKLNNDYYTKNNINIKNILNLDVYPQENIGYKSHYIKMFIYIFIFLNILFYFFRVFEKNKK